MVRLGPIKSIKIKLYSQYSPQARRQDPTQPGMVPTQGLVCNISSQKLGHQKSQIKTLAKKLLIGERVGPFYKRIFSGQTSSGLLLFGSRHFIVKIQNFMFDL